MSTTMTVRLSDQVRDRLDRLAVATQRTRSYLAAEAISEYIDRTEWQVAETRLALLEADAGAFASEEDVSALARKWSGHAD